MRIIEQTKEEVKKSGKREIEQRLINFSVDTISFVKDLQITASPDLGNRLLKSVTFLCLNYGDVKEDDRKHELLYKMTTCLEELRECHNSLRMSQMAKITGSEEQVNKLIKECNELISIFVKSIDKITRSS